MEREEYCGAASRQVNMASEHLKTEEIIRYAAGALEDRNRVSVSRHLAACEVCALKVAHVSAKKISGPCKEVRGLFKGYAANRLNNEEMSFVRDHIVVCDECFEAYNSQIIEARIAVSSSKTQAKEVSKRFKLELGDRDVRRYLINKKGSSAPVPRKPLEINKKDVSLSLKDDAKGQLKIYLKSDKFNLSDVKVSIGKQGKTGFNMEFSGTTGKSGIASMIAEKTAVASTFTGEYAVVLTGLKKKSSK